MMYFMLGYVVFWALIFSYVHKLNRQYRSLQTQIDLLKSEKTY